MYVPTNEKEIALYAEILDRVKTTAQELEWYANINPVFSHQQAYETLLYNVCVFVKGQGRKGHSWRNVPLMRIGPFFVLDKYCTSNWDEMSAHVQQFGILTLTGKVLQYAGLLDLKHNIAV